MDGPTEPQLRYLKNLGYEGEPPLTKDEASFLIDLRKDGKQADEIARLLHGYRATHQNEWFLQQRDYCSRELDQANVSEGFITGFRIFVGRHCTQARQYHGAYLPLEVAKKHPDLLPPFKNICRCEFCECHFEEVFESDKLRKDARLIARPGRVTTIRKWKPRGSRLSGVLVGTLLAIGAYWYWNRDSYSEPSSPSEILGPRTSVNSTVANSGREPFSSVVASQPSLDGIESVKTNRKSVDPRKQVAETPKQKRQRTRKTKKEGSTLTARHEYVDVKITKVAINNVRMMKGILDGTQLTGKKYLVVNVQLTNRKSTGVIDYLTWMPSGPGSDSIRAKLFDESGRSLKQIGLSLGEGVVGGVETATINPNEKALDVLVFQIPSGETKYLTLELPAANVGGSGMIRIRIPAKQIQGLRRRQSSETKPKAP